MRRANTAVHYLPIFHPRVSSQLRFFCPLCPRGGFLLVRRAGVEAVPSWVAVLSTQRTRGSVNELLQLFKADDLFSSRPYQDLVAVQVPFESPVISPQCPSTGFHCNFNAQQTLPILPKFLLQKCIKFQLRIFSLLRSIDLSLIMYLGKALQQPLGWKSCEYIEKRFCCCFTCLASVGFKHQQKLQLLEKWGFSFFRSAFLAHIPLIFSCHFSVKHSHNSWPNRLEELMALNAQVGKK